jgi:hypothetical protein
MPPGLRAERTVHGTCLERNCKFRSAGENRDTKRVTRNAVGNLSVFGNAHHQQMNTPLPDWGGDGGGAVWKRAPSAPIPTYK